MPGDFGDESGEKLFDWMLHVGQRLSEDAMRDAAKSLVEAFRHARGQVDGEQEQTDNSVVRLKMDEFAELPEYETIKDIIDERLTREGVKHQFAMMEGKEYLLFHAEDAPTVSTIFKDLEAQVETGIERAVSEIDKSREDIKRSDDRAHEKAAHDGLDEADSATKKPDGDAKERPSRASDQEPLDERAKRARATAKEVEAVKDVEHEINPVEVKSK